MTYYGINPQLHIYKLSGYRCVNYASMLVIISQVLYVFKSAKYK